MTVPKQLEEWPTFAIHFDEIICRLGHPLAAFKYLGDPERVALAEHEM